MVLGLSLRTHCKKCKYQITVSYTECNILCVNYILTKNYFTKCYETRMETTTLAWGIGGKFLRDHFELGLEEWMWFKPEQEGEEHFR